ncbi:hypothetical protein [Paracoccus onubensis]|uniref:Uncharacterized protein n=1 Tax=Paracoccus onubensis TaxID=1675788 RepID=A0A418SQE7_9RHOB|nr:hypothetical protein [Paracoccus onubensis]RJE83148.1 hypothetical protein D3P04_16990 [Paracoccus onubensis]
MKVLTASLLALGLVASAASAGQFSGTSRNSIVERPAPNTQQIEVRAGSVLTTPELKRANLAADDLITVTSFPSPENARLTNER